MPPVAVIDVSQSKFVPRITIDLNGPIPITVLDSRNILSRPYHFIITHVGFDVYYIIAGNLYQNSFYCIEYLSPQESSLFLSVPLLQEDFRLQNWMEDVRRPQEYQSWRDRCLQIVQMREIRDS